MTCKAAISERLCTWRHGAPRALANHFASVRPPTPRIRHVSPRVLQSLVTLDFGPSSVTLGRDIYGARVTEGGDGASSTVVLSMLALKRCLGMYRDPSCDNAFGFSGIADPPLTTLPRISCLLTRHMPTPPPPTPPHPPPSPPPGFNIDPGKCTNGCHTYFVVAPHQLPSQAALQTWELNIHLNTWITGMHVVIDFPSLRHADHALHVSAVKPSDVAKLIAVTKHSAIIELLETAARDFQVEALGDVESLEVICDLSNVRLFPPPPPPPPQRSEEGEADDYEPNPDVGWGGGQVAPDEDDEQSATSGDPGSTGARPPPPQPPPRSREPMPAPPPPPAGGASFSPLRFLLVAALLVGVAAVFTLQHPEEAANMAALFRARLYRTRLGRRLREFLSQRPFGRKLLLLEARYLGVASCESAADLECADEDGGEAPRALTDQRPRPKPRPAKAEHGGEREVEPLQQRNAEPADAETELNDSDGWPGDGVPFVVRQGDSTLESKLQLDGVAGLKEMQSLISQTCDRLGVDMQRGFRMLLVDSAGITSTVGKSCTMERIRTARRIELVPKDQPSHQCGAQHAGRRPASGQQVPGPALSRARAEGGGAESAVRG